MRVKGNVNMSMGIRLKPVGALWAPCRLHPKSGSVGLILMSSDRYSFLFALPEAKRTLSARKVHIRRLYDILELCIHRNDLARARQAWAILVRCKEVNWKAMWRTGTLLVGNRDDPGAVARDRLEFLTAMMLQTPEAVSTISLK